MFTRVSTIVGGIKKQLLITVFAVALITSSAMPQAANAKLQVVGVGLLQSTIEALAPEVFGEEIKGEFPEIEERQPTRTMTVVATAYSSDPAQTDSTPCIPAMHRFNLCDYYEKYGVEDTIATNILPLGTHVRFPELYGDRIFTVRDRMNAKYNGRARVDFWKKDRPSAVVFGAQRVKMEIF